MKIDESLSKNAQKTYRLRLPVWEVFCGMSDLTPYPSDPDNVASFLKRTCTRSLKKAMVFISFPLTAAAA